MKCGPGTLRIPVWRGPADAAPARRSRWGRTTPDRCRGTRRDHASPGFRSGLGVEAGRPACQSLGSPRARARPRRIIAGCVAIGISHHPGSCLLASTLALRAPCRAREWPWPRPWPPVRAAPGSRLSSTRHTMRGPWSAWTALPPVRHIEERLWLNEPCSTFRARLGLPRRQCTGVKSGPECDGSWSDDLHVVRDAAPGWPHSRAGDSLRGCRSRA